MQATIEHLSAKASKKNFFLLPLLALLFIVVLLVVFSEFYSVPYYALSPGGTFFIGPQVKTTETFKTNGEIEGVYVTQTKLNLLQYEIDKHLSNVSIYESSEIATSPTGKILSSSALFQENKWFQLSSEELAIAAALKEAGYQVPEQTSGALIGWVDPTAPASKVLEQGDIIKSLNGLPTPTTKEFLKLDSLYVKLRVPLHLLIQTPYGTTKTVEITPVGINEGNTLVPYIGIGLMPRFKFPFTISISDLVDGQQLGGPSAGLAYALYLTDALKGGNLTHGNLVAATGTIDSNGNVGPIGGLKQKTISVKASGAKIFFVPALQSSSELATARKIAGKSLKIVPVKTLDQAVEYLKSHY